MREFKKNVFFQIYWDYFEEFKAHFGNQTILKENCPKKSALFGLVGWCDIMTPVFVLLGVEDVKFRETSTYLLKRCFRYVLGVQMPSQEVSQEVFECPESRGYMNKTNSLAMYILT